MSILEFLDRANWYVKAVATALFLMAVATMILVTVQYNTVMDNWQKMTNIQQILNDRTEKFNKMQSSIAQLQSQVDELYGDVIKNKSNIEKNMRSNTRSLEGKQDKK